MAGLWVLHSPQTHVAEISCFCHCATFIVHVNKIVGWAGCFAHRPCVQTMKLFVRPTKKHELQGTGYQRCPGEGVMQGFSACAIT